MDEIGAFEAKNTLGSLLDRVEHGEEIMITRRGKAVAKLVPAIQHDRERARRAVEALKELRKNTGKVTVEELLAMRDEGRKY